jgi:hypothetical protein
MGDNNSMSTKSPTVQPVGHNDPALGGADAAAVLEHFASGQSVAPLVAERVRSRVAQVTEDILRERGVVDDDTFQSLLDDDA